MNNSIDIENKKFTFNGHEISIIFDGDKKPWFNGNAIASILGYARPRKCISDHVDEKHSIKYLELRKYNMEQNIRSNTIYIDERGVLCLLVESKRMDEFKDWMFEELLPVLRKYQYGFNHLKKEIKLYRDMINTNKIQQKFGLLESNNNEEYWSKDRKKEYKLIDTQTRCYDSTCDKAADYEICFEAEYIVINGERITKKILRTMDKNDNKYDYNRRYKCITVYGDFDFISFAKQMMQQEMLWINE